MSTTNAGMRALADRRAATAKPTVTLGWVVAGALKIPEYQPAMSSERVRELTANFDPAYLGTIVVVRRADGDYVLDGQHRMQAAINVGYGGVALKAEIWTNLTPEREREIYLGLADRKTKTRANHVQVKADLGSPAESSVVRLCSERGVKMMNSGGYRHTQPMVMTGIQAAVNLVELRGDDALAWALDVTLSAFDGAPGTLSSEFLNGISQFHAAYPHVPKADLVSALRRDGADAFKMQARAQRLSDTADVGRRRGYHFGRAMLAAYNWRRKNKLADEFNNLAVADDAERRRRKQAEQGN